MFQNIDVSLEVLGDMVIDSELGKESTCKPKDLLCVIKQGILITLPILELNA